MKFKQIIKNNIKRISAVILCLIMIFTLSITTYAFDGEAGGLDKAILEEYNKEASVLFNPQNLTVYSPFNETVLYYTLKWPIVSENLEFSTHEYVALTEYDSTNKVYRTYYLIPERYTLNSFGGIFTSLLNGKTNFPNMYYDLFCSNAKPNSSGTIVSMNTAYSNVKFTDIITSELSTFSLGTSDFTDYMNGYVYCVVRSQSDTIFSISELYYGSYDKCFNYLPTTNICQIYYSSSYEMKGTNQQPEVVSTSNLNYSVSVSTYSITAYDYFDNNAAANGFMSDQIPLFSYRGLGKTGGGTCNITVPECIRGPNYPTEYSTLSMDSTAPNYYLQEGFFTSDRAFIMFPSYNNTSSACHMNIFVFPEGVKSPILYLKYCKSPGGASYTFLQILSKVDYEFYYGNQLQGTFDAETTTYTCIQNNSNINSQGKPMNYELNSSTTTQYGANMQAGVEYILYPYLRYSMGNKNSGISLLNWFGNNTTVSVFPDNSNTLGFYTYISPNIIEEVLDKGNSGSVGGNIFDNIGGNTTPDDPWYIDETIFYDYPEDSIIGGFLPDFPDFSDLLDIDGADIWLLPERVSEKMVECVMWISEAFRVFIDKYDGPISKIFLIASLVFEYIPDYLQFLFIFALCCSLALKMLQYTQSSAFVISGMASSGSSSIGSNNRMDKNSKNEKGGGE